MAWSEGMPEWVYVETIIPSINSRMCFLSTLTFRYKSNPQCRISHSVPRMYAEWSFLLAFFSN